MDARLRRLSLRASSCGFRYPAPFPESEGYSSRDKSLMGVQQEE